jgi:hypothetical protein
MDGFLDGVDVLVLAAGVLRRSGPPFFRSLFTEVLRRGILRSWYAGWCIAPLTGYPMVCLRLLDSSRSTTNIAHLRIKMRSGGCVAFSQNTDTDTGAG